MPTHLSRHNGVDVLIGELFENGGLATVVETEHQQSRLLVSLL